MSIELKIKSKHLSEEARIIRFEEQKQLRKIRYELDKLRQSGHNGDLTTEAYELSCTYRSLNSHRRVDVRNENRATFLARAYLSGVVYSTLEQRRKEDKEYDFLNKVLPRVVEMVAKYGEQKIPKKVWEGVFRDRKQVPNPDFIQLEKAIREWSKL